MKRHFFKKAIILILLISSQIFAQRPDTVWVDDDFTAATAGWGTTHFAVIQNGINAVAKNGTVNVAGGTWNESVEIQEGKSLIGAGIGLSSTTSIQIRNTELNTESIVKNFTLDSNIDNYPALSLRWAYHVTVENIKLLYKGIKISHAHNNTIRNNILNSNGGKFLMQHSNNNIIQGNKLSAMWVTNNSMNNIIEDNLIAASYFEGVASCTGIRSLYSSNNNYKNNIIKNFRVHILLTFSNCNIIDGNNISGERHPNEEGGGVIVFNGDNNSIINNNIDDVAKTGIILFGASCNSQIQANLITNTDHGISLYYGSNNCKVINNTVQDNQWGIILDNTADNLVYSNSIVNCPFPAYDDGNNIWDFGGKGNYWSNYQGKDQNGDGIGDLPQLISPLGNDHFPAMEFIPVISAIEQSMTQDTH